MVHSLVFDLVSIICYFDPFTRHSELSIEGKTLKIIQRILHFDFSSARVPQHNFNSCQANLQKRIQSFRIPAPNPCGLKHNAPSLLQRDVLP
jgi:hypothetical protein